VELAKDPAVLLVAPDTEFAPDYSSTDFLKLSGPNGSWNTQFGGQENAGKGTVVGVIDTGYTPSSPFFSGEPAQPLTGEPQVGVPYRTDDGRIAMLKADGETFTGQCQAGEGFDGTACNSKILGARYFADAFMEVVPKENRSPLEVISPVDVDSHGTHTASTAAGNANIETVVDGRSFGLTSGVAPAAKIAVYKICWEDNDPNSGGCYSSAAVEAIEQAYLDGVDVLNYSISGSTTTTVDPVSLAFLSAVSTGIFVATSAGNSGPAASTVNHGAPWLTTVAASSFSQELQGTVEFSDGSKFRGASIMNSEVSGAGVVLSVNAASGAGNAALCAPGSLDPTRIAGKVVVCDRGVVDRVAKSAEVARGGGVGMILVNLTQSSQDADKHAVPTVHVNPPDTQAIKDKVAANPGITVSLQDSDTTGLPLEAQPQIAGFSSRGPLLATDSDLLKPDVAAPGVAVLAGVSPLATGGDQFGFMSGTSMASPHVAGLAALILGRNPQWSPAALKSAMMTTASDVLLADGTKDTNVLATGAGQMDPRRVLDPGLIYDAGTEDYLKFIQGTGVDLGMEGLGSTLPRNTNLPSFSLGNLTGKAEVTRTVTALTPGMYRAKASVPGIQVSVSPPVLNFNAAGDKRTFKVTFENQGAELGKFTMGSLTWEGSGQAVTSPVAIRPQSVVAPTNVAFSSQDGSGSGEVPIVSGSSAPTSVTVDGLSKADSSEIELVPGPFSATADASNFSKSAEVPTDTPLARFSVISTDETADFDMVVLTPTGAQLVSATGAASEAVTIEKPAAGTYRIYVNLYASPGNRPTKARVDAAVLGANQGNATVTPNPITFPNGKKGKISFSWSDLQPGSYVGRLSYQGASAATFVSVNISGDTVAVLPPAEAEPDESGPKPRKEPRLRDDVPRTNPSHGS
jgi:subtilisin family serine protease